MKRNIIEYTCDVCGTEVDKSILIPSTIDLNGSAKAPETVGATVNLTTGEDVCIYCFIKAINKLDKRPKAIAERSVMHE